MNSSFEPSLSWADTKHPTVSNRQRSPNYLKRGWLETVAVHHITHEQSLVRGLPDKDGKIIHDQNQKRDCSAGQKIQPKGIKEQVNQSRFA